MQVWDEVCGLSRKHTGYTHLWDSKKISPNYLDKLKQYCMASCDTVAEQKKASSMGWRTFRIRLPENNNTVSKSKNLMKQTVVLDDEFVCPASQEAGRKTDCAHCGGCDGLGSKQTKNVCIIIHGVDFKIAKFINGIKSILNKRKWKMVIKKPKKKKRRKRLVAA